jgi:hypothetical protein
MANAGAEYMAISRFEACLVRKKESLANLVAILITVESRGSGVELTSD